MRRNDNGRGCEHSMLMFVCCTNERTTHQRLTIKKGKVNGKTSMQTAYKKLDYRRYTRKASGNCLFINGNT